MSREDQTKLHGDGAYIISPFGGSPLEGLFAIKLGRGLPEHALSVTKMDRLWVVFIDGFQFAPPSEHWEEAFGSIAERAGGWGLIGRRLTQPEYERIIKLRFQDAQSGIDVSEPVDLNRVPTPF